MLTAEGTLLGRWTRAHPSGGFDLLGTDDPEKLTALAYRWGQPHGFECVPCSRRSRAVRSAAKRARLAPGMGAEMLRGRFAFEGISKR